MSKTKRFQLVLPMSLRSKALEGVHDLAGHQGQVRTLHLERQRFFWLKVERDMKEYVWCCERCVFTKTPELVAQAPSESIRTSTPVELLCIDSWSTEDRKKSSVDVVVATNHFTKMPFPFPCMNQTAKQFARKLWDCSFCVYGFPQLIHQSRDPVSRVNWCLNCCSCLAFPGLVPQLIIPWVMEAPNSLTALLGICCKHFLCESNRNGHNRFRH